MKDKYIDNSGDKDYFSMIPHYITNHSTAYEQSLYLQMKRIAGEHKTCWASPAFIGERMQASANTVRKYRKKLLQRGWIKKIGEKRVGKTQQTIGEYEIVDLWQLNMDYYAKLKTSRDETFNQRVQQVSLKPSSSELKPSPVGNKEEPYKKNPIKKKGVSKKETTRKQIKFPKESRIKVEKSYKTLRKIEPQGKEWLPIQQTIKTMFMSNRSVKDIIGCMAWLAGNSEEWMENWTIRTVKLKMPFYIANREKITIKKY